MKRNIVAPKGPKPRNKGQRCTIGMDCVLDEDGQILQETSVNTTRKAMTQAFATMRRCRIAARWERIRRG